MRYNVKEGMMTLSDLQGKQIAVIGYGVEGQAQGQLNQGRKQAFAA